MGYFTNKFNNTPQNVTPEFYDLFAIHHFVAVEVTDLFKITGGDIQLAESLLYLFKVQAENWISNFNNAHTKDEKIHAAHAIKGAARCIAANTLADMAGDIENALRNHQEISTKASFDFIATTANVIHYITSLEAKL